MKKQPNFEAALSALEDIVTKMEKGELSLEASLTEYEQGMALVRDCQKILTDAEQRIKLVSEKNGQISETDFTESI